MTAPDRIAEDLIDLSGPDLDVGVIAHGARLARVRAPGRDGTRGDVVLTLSPQGYRADGEFLGATVGRFANRIAEGRFVLDGTEYQIDGVADGAVLHGGSTGFDHADWTAGSVTPGPGGGSVTLRRTSPDGESGFPGALDLAVTYTVAGRDVVIELTATTDAPTVVNLTNHAYFTLDGLGGAPGVEDHEITLYAAHYLPVDDRLIPTGELAPVADTPFALRGDRIGAGLRADHPQLHAARGYDHCVVLDGSGPRSGTDDDLPAAAHVRGPRSGRTLTVFTDQPGLQFYSGNFLNGSFATADGVTVRQGDAFCLEAQAFPDAPNQPGFPSAVLRPGETYRNRIRYRFGVDG